MATDACRRRRGGTLRVVAFTVALALPWWVTVAPAQAQQAPAPSVSAVRVVETTVMPGEQALAARWTLPAGPPRGLALLQHGFTRRCANLAGTMRHWAGAGLAVLCVDVSGVQGAAWLPDELADALVDGRITLPEGEPLPWPIVVAGHSAGAAFAARVGGRLAERAPGHLAGAVLLDPVASRTLEDDLARILRDAAFPVRALFAAPGPCNAEGSGAALLQRLGQTLHARGTTGVVGVGVGHGSTHLDAEGGDSTSALVSLCGQGPPQPAPVQRLRAFGARWAVEMVSGACVQNVCPADAAASIRRDADAPR